MKRVLTIAGSDSGGGAGIQADIKTITLLGAYASSAITALTAQNTRGVFGISAVEPEFVAKQIEAVLTDIGTDAAKTGMLYSRAVIEAVAGALERFKVPNLVVDPVMVSKSGDSLLEDDAVAALVEKIFPLAAVVTPNAREAGRILGRPVEDVEDAEEAARELVKRGYARAAVVKGGHVEGEAVDVLCDGEGAVRYPGARIETRLTHGTGCTYSAAIATFLALGHGLREAVGRAKAFVSRAIRLAEPIGKGSGPTNHYAAALGDVKKVELHVSLIEGLRRLQEARIGSLIPEVQSNLAAAMPWSRRLEEVAAFPGRIARMGDEVRVLDWPDFGASSHMARALLAAKERDPSVLAAMNIRYSEEAVKAAERAGLRVAEFERSEEPRERREREDSTLDWAVGWVFEKYGFVPDVIFDKGAVGKEAMVRVFGRSPIDVAEKVIRIKETLEGKSFE